MPVRISRKLDDILEPRALVVGIIANNTAKAYPFSALEKQSPIVDSVGGRDILVVLGEDGKSVRAFDRAIDGKTLEFFVDPASSKLMDAETGSVWDFGGNAVSGALARNNLERINVLKDYWFDWKNYHPETGLYSLGPR
jgi:hypothetical protein